MKRLACPSVRCSKCNLYVNNYSKYIVRANDRFVLSVIRDAFLQLGFDSKPKLIEYIKPHVAITAGFFVDFTFENFNEYVNGCFIYIPKGQTARRVITFSLRKVFKDGELYNLRVRKDAI